MTTRASVCRVAGSGEARTHVPAAHHGVADRGTAAPRAG